MPVLRVGRASLDSVRAAGTVNPTGLAAEGSGVPASFQMSRLTSRCTTAGGAVHDVRQHVFTLPCVVDKVAGSGINR